jgi:deoxyribonuclease V
MGNSEVALEFSFCKARRAQNCVAQKVIDKDHLPKKISLVGGVDAAYAGDVAFGVAVVLDYDSFEFREAQIVTQKVKFPYVSTLLSFRELPVAAVCIRKLKLQPDVLLVDGHGKAHPYGCGLASHLGVAMEKPTVGVAKRRLVGEPKRVGEDTFLVQDGEVIGAVVSTRNAAKPVYVSVGHMVSLATAVEIVKHCSRISRVPEPIRLAHRLASEERKAKMAVDANKL